MEETRVPTKVIVKNGIKYDLSRYLVTKKEEITLAHETRDRTCCSDGRDLESES